MPFRIVFVLLPLALLTAWLVYAATRPLTNGSVPRWVPVSAAVIVGLLLLQQSYMEFRWISTERAATDVTREIAGDDVGVHCQRLTETLFYAWADRGRVAMRSDGAPDDTALLTWEVCRDLRDWLSTDRTNPSLDQIVALHIVVHEAVHLTGQFNEGQAECTAMAREAAAAESLGASPTTAELMVHRYRTEVYPHLTGTYRSGDCPPR